MDFKKWEENMNKKWKKMFEKKKKQVRFHYSAALMDQEKDVKILSDGILYITGPESETLLDEIKDYVKNQIDFSGSVKDIVITSLTKI